MNEDADAERDVLAPGTPVVVVDDGSPLWGERGYVWSAERDGEATAVALDRDNLGRPRFSAAGDRVYLWRGQYDDEATTRAQGALKARRAGR